MATSRRGFTVPLPVGLAAGSSPGETVAQEASTSETSQSERGHRITDFSRRLGREGLVSGLSKRDLPTPALVLDLAVFEANLKRMAEHARSAGKGLRPHAKTHKCVQIARRQVAAGAQGVCVATVAEAEVMITGGIAGVLLTSPVASPEKVRWITQLLDQSDELMVVVDHAAQAELYEQAAADAGHTLNVLVDLNVGDQRTGAEPGEPALQLARTVAGCRHLRLRGLQSYSGRSSHVVGFEERRSHSHDAMSKAIETRARLLEEGLPAEILSGGSTGTYNIDSELEGITELQVGSYVFMDVDYRRIGGCTGEQYDDFGHSLTVLTTVVSANQAGRVSLDAGIKASATDRSFGPEVKGLRGVSYRFGGDEFGVLQLEEPSRPVRLGDRLELMVAHCDPTVNLYDRIYACRDERVEEIWSVMDRL